MQIFLKTLSGKTLILNVKPSDSIADIKDRIETLEGVPKDSQRLMSYKELKDQKTLFDYNIKNLATIHLLLTLKSSLQIKIKTLSKGIILNLNANPSDTIFTIKQKILDYKGININRQQLIFGGKILNNQKTLDNYNIYDDLVIFLVCF